MPSWRRSDIPLNLLKGLVEIAMAFGEGQLEAEDPGGLARVAELLEARAPQVQMPRGENPSRMVLERSVASFRANRPLPLMRD